MRDDIIIRPEQESEFEEIDKVVRRSFVEGANSDGDSEIALIHEIRTKKYYIPELSFVAIKNEQIVGHFMFSHFPLSHVLELGNYDKNIIKTPTVILAPVAVHADYLKQNIGATMLQLGIEKVKACGYRGIQVEGNPNFYRKVGFETSSKFMIYPTSGFPMKHPECMMMQETYQGSLRGINGYADYSMYETLT